MRPAVFIYLSIHLSTHAPRHARTHTHAHTHTRLLFFAYTHTCILSLSLSLSHTHTHTPKTKKGTIAHALCSTWSWRPAAETDSVLRRRIHASAAETDTVLSMQSSLSSRLIASLHFQFQFVRWRTPFKYCSQRKLFEIAQWSEPRFRFRFPLLANSRTWTVDCSLWSVHSFYFTKSKV